jgi:hypothetical protein
VAQQQKYRKSCPIARRKVAGYFKLHKWVERESEISELERQWNG